MKSSTLRCSFGSIQSSGLKVPFEPSPRGIWPAIWHGRSETSKFSTRPIPLSPASSRCHVGSTPQASGVSIPRPVTTTRLIIGAPGKRFARCYLGQACRRSIRPPVTAGEHHARARNPCSATEQCRVSALRVLFEELDGVAHGENRFGGVVGNLATKFLLEGHDEFDRVEAVGAEIIDEAGVFGYLVGLDAEMLHDDLLHPLANITHRFQPLLCSATRSMSRPRDGQ